MKRPVWSEPMLPVMVRQSVKTLWVRGTGTVAMGVGVVAFVERMFERWACMCPIVVASERGA